MSAGEPIVTIYTVGGFHFEALMGDGDTTTEEAIDAANLLMVDGQPIYTYEQRPNTPPRTVVVHPGHVVAISARTQP